MCRPPRPPLRALAAWPQGSAAWQAAVLRPGRASVGACQHALGLLITYALKSLVLFFFLSPFSYKLWLADWGYNTAEERAAAAALPGVRLLSRPQFCELLKWGVVMEVRGLQPFWPAA